MPVIYSSEPSNLKPATIDDATLLQIGKLIRATAEIEDLITLYICNLAEINASKAIILLGRTAVTRRLEIAEYLASMIGPHVTQLHKANFTALFGEVLSCRNAVAHGIFMGMTENGRYAFLTAKTVETTIPSAVQIVESYRPSDIKEFARVAEEFIPILETNLKLQPLRAERLRRPLSPHRKGLKGKQGVKP
jgi:hypothetical protein